MGTQYSPEELALLKKHIVESTSANLPFGQPIDVESIVDVDVVDTLNNSSLVTLNHTVDGKVVKSVPFQIKRENLSTVVQELDLTSAFAGVDFTKLTVEDVAETLTEAGLTIDAASIEITDAIEELLVIRCTRKSVRYKGEVRIVRTVAVAPIEADDE